MSSDGKEPGAVWQGPASSGWGHSFDQPQPPNQGGQPFSSNAQDQEEEAPDTSAPLEEESTPGRVGLVNSLLGPFKQFGQYATLILFPLLFGGLTCLSVLLALRAKIVSIPGVAVGIIIAIIVVLALIQGLAVYYIGEENSGFRIAITVFGFFLFVVVGCFSVFGWLVGVPALVILIIASIALISLTVHSVPEGCVDVVYSFGKYSRMLYRGLNVIMPWEKVTKQLNIEETHWVCPVQRVQLSHDQDVMLRAAISYQLLAEDAYLAVTQVNRWEESLHELFVTTLQSIVPTFTPDDFLIWPQGFHASPRISQELNAFAEGSARWEQISNLLFQKMSDKVALWGVVINWVSIRDIYLAPHDVVILQPNTKVEPEDTTVKTPTQQTKNASPKAAQEAPPVAASQPAAASAANASPAPKPTKADNLVKIYKLVQSGKITDPDTIRSFAEKFEAVANNPKTSQEVDFDAARAALNLYAQAKKYEQQQKSMAPLYSNETSPELPKPHPVSTDGLVPGES